MRKYFADSTIIKATMKRWQKRRDLRVLLFAIRHCKKYVDWRDAVLKSQVASYPEIPKNIQVHHIYPLTKLLKNNLIKSLEEAEKCDALWDVHNGVALLRGEHFILSFLQRHKSASPGFLKRLKSWVAYAESNVNPSFFPILNEVEDKEV